MNTLTKNGSQSNLKMGGKLNLTRTCTWAPIQSQMSEIMALLEPQR